MKMTDTLNNMTYTKKKQSFIDLLYSGISIMHTTILNAESNTNATISEEN